MATNSEKIICQSIFDRVKKHEGLMFWAYDDATGKPLKTGDTIKGKISIGIGRNIQHGSGLAMPDDILLELFKRDLSVAYRVAQTMFNDCWGRLGIKQQGALVELSFWLGGSGLGEFVKMAAAVRRGDFKAAAKEIMDSKMGRQFKKRAQTVADLMEGK